MASIPRLKQYRGPAILSYGFRPFFLFGSIYAGIAILVWLAMIHGDLALPTAFTPRDWHIHEMLYGYLPAVITGFLLTAIPNWTGRLPIQGKPLLMLVVAWATGRLVVAASLWTGWLPAALIDVSFLLMVVIVAAREILAGSNRQNLKILAVLAIFLAGNVSFHLEAHLIGEAVYGTRLGIAAAIMLIVIIGGRVVPSFTRNWLVRRNPGRLPSPIGRYDLFSIAVTAAALLLWTAAPTWPNTGVALMVAGAVQTVRLARWAGYRTWSDRLVLVLHIGYAFVPLGLVLSGLSALDPAISASAGIHAWTAGAIGTMTIAIMSRASLGHTGRALVAAKTTQMLYVLLIGGALLRITAALAPNFPLALLPIAGLAWAAAFIGVGVTYRTILTGVRASSPSN